MGGTTLDEEDLDWKHHDPLPRWSRLCWWLSTHGFLRRDPDETGWDQNAFAKMRWQWRFWRGPYWAAIEARQKDDHGPT